MAPCRHGSCFSARLLRLQARLSDNPFGGLALVANEARELLKSDPRRLDGTIDVHSLPEVALIDNARDLKRESRDDRLRGVGRREQAEPCRGVVFAAADLRQRGNIGKKRRARFAGDREGVMWPLCSWGTMLESGRIATGVVPDSTALTTSLPLLKGMRTISAPVSCLSFSMKCARGNENVP